MFTLDGCPVCKKTVDLISAKTSDFRAISLTQSPEWKPQLFLLTGGQLTVPQVFFNEQYIGGANKLEQLDKEGKLEGMIKACLESGDSPLELTTPKGSEFVEVIPKTLRDKWQGELVTELAPQLGATPERPITGLMMILDTPSSEMAVICSAGEASVPFPPGMTGPKGKEGSEEKFYCQVALESSKTLFFDGPSTFPPGLKENYDHVQFGYSWYLGAPWQVRDIKGTVVVLEKEAGILKPEHERVVEAFRDRVQKELKEYFGDPPVAEAEKCSDSGCKA